MTSSWGKPPFLYETQGLAPFFPERGDDAVARLWQELPGRERLFLSWWRQHFLTPLLYHQVRRQGWQDALASWLVEELRADYARAVRTAHQEEGEMGELLRSLAQAGVAVMLLKGADLRRRLYGDPALRPMIDVDLLIAPAAVPAAQAVLQGLGYRLNLPSPRAAKFAEKFGHELLFQPPPGKKLLVEPHWQIRGAACYYCLPYEPLRLAAVPLDDDGSGAGGKVLSPEHLLLHLCLHAYRNPELFALQKIDLAWALKRLPWDGPLFLQEVKRFRCFSPVSDVLQEICALSSYQVPPEVWAALKSHRPSRSEKLVIALQGTLRGLSQFFPALPRHRRLWEMATFVMAHLRSRFPNN